MTTETRHADRHMTKRLIKSFLLAGLILTGIVYIPGARAQLLTQTNAQLGDLILGFETTGGGGTKDLLIDLGSATNTAELLSLNLNLKSDLTNAFATNYASTVSYGLYSVTTNKVIYASGPANLANGGYQLESSSSASLQKTAFQDLFGEFNNDGLSGQTSTHGVYEATTETYTWGSFNPSSGAFNNNFYGNIESAIGTTSDLYVQPLGSSSSYGTFTDLAFTVSNLGLLTVAAVPEPSTYALFGLGVLLFVITYRRSIGRRSAEIA